MSKTTYLSSLPFMNAPVYDFLWLKLFFDFYI